ncbi:MAG: OmpA family protein [Flavobacteriales bacterium]|jgi:outer membrane protein OmpA-like peptidoglycan-associated protein|nr:OmpA family protein [Flavobacteriales bacterium]
MIKRYNSLLIASAMAFTASAQEPGPNLVANGDFENLQGTVSSWDQLGKANGWSNANGGSVDVFSSTGNAKNVGIPVNHLGTSNAFAGNHYAGFVAWHDDQRPNPKFLLNKRTEGPYRPAWNQYSEYLQIALSSPLTEGQKYIVSFQVKLADQSDRAVSGIGAYLSPTELALRHRGHLDVKPQVAATEVITDRKDWTEVSGVFTASGQEKFVVLGAFPLAGMEKTSVIEGPDSRRAYYYIDGISVNLKPEDDRDGDGVIDKEDACPDEPGPASTQGCPDGDGDGVADKDDKCPDLAGPAEWDGCPDSDGDGIPDHQDRCPTVAGVPEMRGCPPIKEETRKLFEKALTGIQFETGSAKIRRNSFSILDDVVKVMQENPAYNLDIHGHTDNTGNADKNLQLSKDRAGSVRDYLVSKGVNANRLRSEGFGITQPVADNKTSAGRAKNRRVEFKVTFFE